MPSAAGAKGSAPSGARCKNGVGPTHTNRMDWTVYFRPSEKGRSSHQYHSTKSPLVTRLTGQALRYILGFYSALFVAHVASASSLTATVGQDVTISVTANGTAPFSYQWYRNGSAISGATSASYLLDNVDALDSANYYAIVKNRAGSTTSDTANLTVKAPAAVAPKITTQPSAVTVNLGQSATLRVVATGTGPLTYTWRKNGSKVGTNSSTLTITTTVALDAGSYSVTVSNSAGSVTSNAVTLGINLTQILTKPSITKQPVGTVVSYSEQAAFSVTASGTGPLRYQWKKNGVSISGATSPNYTIMSATASDSADYTVQITNTLGSVTSQAAHLRVAVPGS